MQWLVCACRRLGRKLTILIAGACFIIGITLCAAAVHIGMLIIGRIVIGLGVGFGNQVSSCRSQMHHTYHLCLVQTEGIAVSLIHGSRVPKDPCSWVAGIMYVRGKLVVYG